MHIGFYLVGAVVLMVAVVLIIWMAFPSSTGWKEKHDLIAAAARGDVFLAEPYSGPFAMCACLGGLPVAGHVAWGAGAGIGICLACMRKEFDAWTLWRVQQQAEASVGVGGSCNVLPTRVTDRAHS